MKFLLRVVTAGISLYQRTLSPDHGPLRWLFPFGICRYTPTCSQYAHQAITRHGWPGVIMAIRRVGRCHPGHIGGSDPVPFKTSKSYPPAGGQSANN